MKKLTFKAAMWKGSRPTVNRQSTDGQSQRHCKQTPLSKRWKVLMTLVFLFTFAIGNVWGAAGDATTSNAPKSGGTSKDYANTISVAAGYLDGNVMYYISNNLTFISTDGLEANYLGFVFKPSVDLTIDFEGFNGNSGDVNITYQIDSIADAAFYEVFTEAGSNKISEKIISDNGGASASSTHTVLNYWKDNGVVKYSSKKWQSNGDNAPKNLAGQQNTTYFGNTRLVTDKVVAISSTKSAAAGTYSFMRDATNKFVFKAGKVYRIYSTRGSSKTGYKSFTFTPVYQLTWNFDEGASSETAGTDYTATGYYVKDATLAYPSDESMSKDGFVFDGWSSSATKMPASALTITAQWAALGSCVATAPGAITKGAASEGVLTLTAEGTPADNNTWYWQDAADGTATDKGSGATKNVNAAGTYYLRSFNDDGGSGCWSAAKSVTVDAADLLTAISPTLSYGANVIVGNTLSPALEGNAGNGAVTYALNDVTPAGSLTINESTGVVTAVTAGGTATVTATITKSGYYAGNTATSGTITVIAAPTHLIENRMAVSGNWDSYILTNNAHISGLVTITPSAGKTLIKSGKESASGGRTPGITSNSSATLVESDYIYIQFTIESGYELTLSEISVPVFKIASGNGNYVARISDASNSIESDVLTLSKDGTGNPFNEYDFSSSQKLSGTVTLKLFAYGWSDGYRMESPLYIDGTVTAKKVVKTTDYALTDVKVNGTSISAANLATLKTAIAYKVDLADQFAAAPTIKFNKETTITYTDDSQKVTDEEISVDATIVDGKWQAQAEIGGITYTVTAVKVTSFTVNYFDEDGTTSLGSEVVSVTGHPNASEITVPTKSFKTFADWKLSGTVVDLNNVSAGAGESVDLVASYTPAYAQSINIEQWVLDNSKNNTAFRAVLDARHYEYANLNDVDSLRADKNDGDRNEPYLGQKWKLATSEISFLLKSGYTVRVKFGNVGSDVNIKLGDNDPFPKTAAQLESPYEYTATEDVIVRLQGTGTGTVVVKQIMIDEAIAAVKLHAVVTYDAGAGTFGKANEKYTGTPLVIADATPAEDYTFAGWFLGEDQINAAAYEPAKDITLVAHYAPQEFAIAYDGNGATSGSMSAGAAGWGTMVTPDANAFEKTGHVFSGWEITKTSDGSATGITFSEGKFEMPKYDVTLVAQWVDNSSVVKVVREEYEQKYDNFLDARNDVRDNGGTIVVLQDIENMSYYGVNAAITIDLNGHRLATAEGNNMFLVYDGGSLTINGTTEGSAVHGRINVGSNAGSDGTLVLNGGTYTCAEGNTCIHVHGESDNSVVTINGATITSPDDNGVQFNGKGVYTVTDATITGGTGIYIKSGELTITNSTVTGNLSPVDYSYNGNGSNPTGDGIVVDACNYPGGAPTINIISGDFSGTKSAVGSYNYQGTSEPAIGGIKGGTFSSRVPNDLCAPGLVPSAANAQGKYSVEPKDATSLIKAVATATSQDITGENLTGIYKGAAHISASGSYKFNQGNYFMVQLKDGENFQAGDIVKINVASVNDCNGFTIYSADEFTSANLIIDTHENSDAKAQVSTGVNEVELPNTYAGSNKLYVARCGDCDKYLNAGINQVEVTRVVYPELKAITIDGRDGVINEAAKTVAVQIPYEADLAALAVVPTIAWNAAAAENSIVVNNGGAWVEAPATNTYRLTDKDGDYTDYIITLTRDVQKHAVKFYDGETLLETVEVEDGESIAAGDVPADPEKEDYIFQGWAETAGGDVVEVTSFTISAAKNFYAKWAADGAIKLINKTSGAINEDGYFITGATATVANSEKAAAWGGTQGNNISGVNALGKIVQYNATTNKTKLQIKVYNTNGSDKYVYIHKVIEGKTTEEAVETLTATSNAVVTSEYYEFNDTKNRSFYLTTNSTDVKILQVKVIDDGATPMKQAGEAGYSLNLNKGRVVYYGNSDVTFEGLALQSGSNYGVINSSEFQTVKNLSFSISSPVLLKVTTNSAKYYVSQNPNEDGTTATAITTAGTAEFELTETTNPWYLVPSTTSNVKYTNIAFELPKAATPVIETQPATNHTFDPGDMTATVVATVTEGTLHYQWYKKATVGDDEEVGTDAATLTTTTEGTYYVVVTNTLAGHQDVSVTSEEAELGYRVTNDATLMALSYGGTAITLEDGVYTYNVELAKGTTDVPALAATATMDGYADVDINDAAEFVNYEASSTVTVKSEDETETLVYTVNFYVKHDLPQVDVTESTTWDWTNAATTMQTIKPATKNVEQLMANIDDNGKKLKNDDEFNSQALIFSGQEALVGNNTRWYAKGGHIKFNVTVPGIVKVEFSDNGGNNRRLKINNYVSTESSASETDVKTYAAYVEAGEVTLMGVKNDSTGTDQYIRISKIEFKAEDNYHRTVNPNNIGTLCWTNDAILANATLYELAGKNEYNKLVFDEVSENRLVAGKPYIFVPENGNSLIRVFNTSDETRTSPIQNESGMQGTFVNLSSADGTTLWGNYIISNNHYIYVDYTNVNVGAYRAYILGLDDLNVVSDEPQQDPNGAPRRRLTIGDGNAPAVTTGVEGLHIGDQPVKVMIDGQIFILRGEKMYDVTGKLVK